MRKQVDFDVRVFPLGNGANETMTREAVGKYIRENYLLKPNYDEDGKVNLSDKSYWEVLAVETNQVSGGVIYYQTTLVKYEDEPVAKVVGGSSVK